MSNLLKKATAKVRIRRSGRFDGQVKTGADAIDGRTVHLIGGGVCEDHSLYEGEPRWDLDIAHYASQFWPEDAPVWFAEGDLENIQLQGGE